MVEQDFFPLEQRSAGLYEFRKPNFVPQILVLPKCVNEDLFNGIVAK